MATGRLAASVLVVSGCYAATPVMHFGSGKSSAEAQQQTIGELMPPQLDAGTRAAGPVRTLKLRVWADDDFRAQNVSWQRTFQEELDYANTLLGPMFGIRFDAEYRAWHHHAPGNTLSDEIDALAVEDPGSDVFSVVGLTSALPLVSATFDQLGVGALPGRYIMLRGYADVYERKAFDRAFPKVPADERASIADARRRHKTTATLLHELGHNLGAPHDDAPDTIMNPIYSHHSASFSERSRDIMLATLAGRLGRPAAPVAAGPHAAAKHPTVVVTISDAGATVVGGNAIDNDTLVELLRLSVADDHDTEVIVRAGRGAPHDAVVRAIDGAKAAGVGRVAVEAEDSR